MPKLNKTNINKVIKSISNENNYFSMDYYSRHGNEFNLNSYETVDFNDNTCGTASCICGWANQIKLIETGDGVFDFHEISSFYSGAAWLGLNNEEADELFHVKSGVINFSKISRNQTIAVLENLKKTGKVNWSVAEQ